MKDIKKYIIEQHIKILFESLENPDLSECKLIDDCSEDGYKLYLTPHGSKRMHRSKDEYTSLFNDYSIKDIKDLTYKGFNT